MSTAQEGSYSQQQHVDRMPMPSDIPHVDEVGATSAPLKSAAFFIGAYCKDYNGSFRSILLEKRVTNLILFF
jgi:NADH dehydrogenase (ubiquinone) 1 alpha subcomplex subunit 8